MSRESRERWRKQGRGQVKRSRGPIIAIGVVAVLSIAIGLVVFGAFGGDSKPTADKAVPVASPVDAAFVDNRPSYCGTHLPASASGLVQEVERLYGGRKLQMDCGHDVAHRALIDPDGNPMIRTAPGAFRSSELVHELLHLKSYIADRMPQESKVIVHGVRPDPSIDDVLKDRVWDQFTHVLRINPQMEELGVNPHEVADEVFGAMREGRAHLNDPGTTFLRRESYLGIAVALSPSVVTMMEEKFRAQEWGNDAINACQPCVKRVRGSRFKSREQLIDLLIQCGNEIRTDGFVSTLHGIEKLPNGAYEMQFDVSKR